MFRNTMSGMESTFHDVIKMPDEYWVFDFTRGPNTEWDCPFDYQVGRYDEHRPGMYTTELFANERDLHVGIDLGGPVGTPIYAFSDGVIHSFGVNPEDGSYGPTIITQHIVQLPESIGSVIMGPKIKLWALHGHLSIESLDGLKIGQKIIKGQELGKIGNERENGGWPPHLHFQLCLIKPLVNDLPGVVKLIERDEALEKYPDPRLVLGELY